MDSIWKKFIEEEQKKDYFKNLNTFLESEYNTQTVYPPKNLIYNAFELTKFKDIKVVILGQDPYHGFNQANGLAFSVNPGVNFPPSLRNIFKEVMEDTNATAPIFGNLERWAEQGVFLLNDVLTVREANAGSHQKKGWEIFTDNVISFIAENSENVVFMLWGNYAQKKGKKIDNEKHLVLKSGHPSPMSANQGKWFGNKHFSQANTYLLQHNKTQIEW